MSERGPVVAIVGRQNVGKSSLFNRLVGRRVAIEDPKAGTTIDRIEERVDYRDLSFTLLDTGGWGIDRADPLRRDVLRQIEFAVSAADLVVMVVDVASGVTGPDREMAERLRREKKNIILAVNKVDTERRRPDSAEFYRLGLGDPVILSVAANRGVDDLLDRIGERLPRRASVSPPEELRIAIVGRRNAGKSTYVNALAGAPRVIVSEKPGTTRDAVDVALERDGRRFLVIDTAGMRKRTRIQDSVERFSLMRSEGAIHRAHGVILLLEAPRPVSQVEKNLARRIEESFKPVVLAMNKWDLVPRSNRQPDKFRRYLERAFPVLSFAPVSFMSAKQDEGIWAPVEKLLSLIETFRRRVGTGELNRVVERVLQTAPLPLRGTREGRVLYATQAQASPPTVVCFVKNKAVFHRAYLKHIERTMREMLPFREVPIRIVLREKAGR
jgi:GTP-binding protein